MPDYKTMYGKLFHAITHAIDILQKVQQETEELYISSEEPTITVFERFHINNNDEDTNRSNP